MFEMIGHSRYVYPHMQGRSKAMAREAAAKGARFQGAPKLNNFDLK